MYVEEDAAVQKEDYFSRESKNIDLPSEQKELLVKRGCFLPERLYIIYKRATEISNEWCWSQLIAIILERRTTWKYRDFYGFHLNFPEG